MFEAEYILKRFFCVNIYIVVCALDEGAHCLLGMIAICNAIVTNQSNYYQRRSISLDYIDVARCSPCVLLILPVMCPHLTHQITFQKALGEKA